MKYFETLQYDKMSIVLLKYPIALDENMEIKKEFNKIVKHDNIILDLLIKNGNTSNRFFNVTFSNNRIEMTKYSRNKEMLEQFINHYLRQNVYLLLESALSSYEINKILCDY